MHRRIYQEFERICSERQVGGKVLEVGALPVDHSLLCMNALGGATEKLGINLDGPFTYRDFRVLKGNANSMDCFEDGYFDTVLCNALLEHDRFFWKTIAEIYRVTKKDGVIVIGTPGYTMYSVEVIKKAMRKIPLFSRLSRHGQLNALFTATLTYEIHDAPGDYYRFSPQIYREFFFMGCRDVHVQTVMLPPRVIGSGIKDGGQR